MKLLDRIQNSCKKSLHIACDFLFRIAVMLWLTWHLIIVANIYINPVSLVEDPIGYHYWDRKETYYQNSYIRIKNKTSRDQSIKLELSAVDSLGEIRRFNIIHIEKWGDEKIDVKINRDMSIIIPPKAESGFYLEAQCKNAEELGFPIFTEQIVKIIR